MLFQIFPRRCPSLPLSSDTTPITVSSNDLDQFFFSSTCGQIYPTSDDGSLCIKKKTIGSTITHLRVPITLDEGSLSNSSYSWFIWPQRGKLHSPLTPTFTSSQPFQKVALDIVGHVEGYYRWCHLQQHCGCSRWVNHLLGRSKSFNHKII